MGVDSMAWNGSYISTFASSVCSSASWRGTPLAVCIDSLQCMWAFGRDRIVAHVRPLSVHISRCRGFV